jgi:UDP-3-O-[3-hydroxymyristoyl] N-acetylglucosamine deacetylase
MDAVLEGVGLHTGALSRVVLRTCSGPVVLRARGEVARIEELNVASTERATTVEARGGAIRVATVEHLFAALAGLGVYEGLAIEIDGPEMPLLDGGAARWCEAIDSLGVEPSPPRARVRRQATIAIGASRYEFSPAEIVTVEARLELDGHDDSVVAARASWRGDAGDFRARIAPARTFALERDVETLAARGLARHVDRASVLVLTPGAILYAGRAPEPDEPARHKLLDLLGDLYLDGGPPCGSVRALRPGHAANTEAMRRARAEGIVTGSVRP